MTPTLHPQRLHYTPRLHPRQSALVCVSPRSADRKRSQITPNPIANNSRLLTRSHSAQATALHASVTPQRCFSVPMSGPAVQSAYRFTRTCIHLGLFTRTSYEFCASQCQSVIAPRKGECYTQAAFTRASPCIYLYIYLLLIEGRRHDPIWAVLNACGLP